MALIEKLKPNYKFKWEHENFPTDACVNVHIMQWMDFVAQLNWYFLPSREQDGQISNTCTCISVIKPTKKKEMNAFHDHHLTKKIKFMLTGS